MKVVTYEIIPTFESLSESLARQSRELADLHRYAKLKLFNIKEFKETEKSDLAWYNEFEEKYKGRFEFLRIISLDPRHSEEWWIELEAQMRVLCSSIKKLVMKYKRKIKEGGKIGEEEFRKVEDI